MAKEFRRRVMVWHRLHRCQGDDVCHAGGSETASSAFAGIMVNVYIDLIGCCVFC